MMTPANLEILSSVLTHTEGHTNMFLAKMNDYIHTAPEIHDNPLHVVVKAPANLENLRRMMAGLKESDKRSVQTQPSPAWPAPDFGYEGGG